MKKVPSILQSVEFGSLGKLYQGFGIQNDMGGVEFFHPDYTKNPVTLRACGITTVLNPKVKDTQVCCLFYDFMDYLAYCSLQGSAELREDAQQDRRWLRQRRREALGASPGPAPG